MSEWDKSNSRKSSAQSSPWVVYRPYTRGSRGETPEGWHNGLNNTRRCVLSCIRRCRRRCCRARLSILDLQDGNLALVRVHQQLRESIEVWHSSHLVYSIADAFKSNGVRVERADNGRPSEEAEARASTSLPDTTHRRGTTSL